MIFFKQDDVKEGGSPETMVGGLSSKEQKEIKKDKDANIEKIQANIANFRAKTNTNFKKDGYTLSIEDQDSYCIPLPFIKILAEFFNIKPPLNFDFIQELSSKINSTLKNTH